MMNLQPDCLNLSETVLSHAFDRLMAGVGVRLEHDYELVEHVGRLP
jgi:hypothetical protein